MQKCQNAKLIGSYSSRSERHRVNIGEVWNVFGVERELGNQSMVMRVVQCAKGEVF